MQNKTLSDVFARELPSWSYTHIYIAGAELPLHKCKPSGFALEARFNGRLLAERTRWFPLVGSIWQAELDGIGEALDLMLLLPDLTGKCAVLVLRNPTLVQSINKWLPAWKAADFKDAEGADRKNAHDWRQIAGAIEQIQARGGRVAAREFKANPEEAALKRHLGIKAEAAALKVETEWDGARLFA